MSAKPIINESSDKDRPPGAAVGAGSALRLSDRTPLAKGNARLVFEHPDDPSLLVKIVRPDVIDRRFGSGSAWYKRRRRSGPFLSYVREIREYISVHATHGHPSPFLQTIVGLAETDLGLGLVTRAARDHDGGLAPNIAMLIESGRFDSTVRGDLQIFFQRILESDVIISDMNVGNLVYEYDSPDSRRFVLIDGLGNSNLIPLKRLSRTINRRSKRRRFARLYKRITRRLERAGHPMPPMPRVET